MNIRFCYLITIAMALGLTACGQGPQPFNQGKDQCNHCRMTISDVRFASQIVTRKGKVYKFDDVRCVKDFVRSGSIKAADVREYYVVDYNDADKIIPVGKAFFLSSQALKSPMNGNIAAFSNEEALNIAKSEVAGEIVKWDSILK